MWELQWQFPFNSSINLAQDVFDPGVQLRSPEDGSGSPNWTVLESSRDIEPGTAFQFGFLGVKGPGGMVWVLVGVYMWGGGGGGGGGVGGVSAHMPMLACSSCGTLLG